MLRKCMPSKNFKHVYYRFGVLRIIFIDDHELIMDEFLEAYNNEDLIFYVWSICLNPCLDISIYEVVVICNSDSWSVRSFTKENISETK